MEEERNTTGKLSNDIEKKIHSIILYFILLLLFFYHFLLYMFLFNCKFSFLQAITNHLPLSIEKSSPTGPCNALTNYFTPPLSLPQKLRRASCTPPVPLAFFSFVLRLSCPDHHTQPPLIFYLLASDNHSILP